MNSFFHQICKKLEQNSTQKSIISTINGIIIQELILSKYTSAEIIHHKASAQESPMNIFAGFILNHKNASIAPIIIPITVVAKNQLLTNVITPRTPNTISINHQTRPSRPSVILIALTIITVVKKVNIGYKSQNSTSPANGQKLKWVIPNFTVNR